MNHPGSTLAEIERIIGMDAPVFARMVGVPGLMIRLERSGDAVADAGANAPGIRWNPRSKELTVAPDMFLAKEYTGEEIVYAILIETLVSVRQPLIEPELTADLERFVKRGQEAAIFHSVFSGLAASRRAHAVLPRWERIGRHLYGQRLYPETQYLDAPRHLQFLYKTAREQMIPGSSTEVAGEVDELLAEFHDYLGTGRDLLAYSTQPASSATKAMTGVEQFSIWTRNVYPRWVELLELDREDLETAVTRRVSTGERRVANFSEHRREDFAEFYEQHRTRRQHQPVRAQEELRRAVGRQSRKERSDPGLLLDAQLRAETGHGRSEYKRYTQEVDRFRVEVDEIRGVYRDLLQSHLHRRRMLRGGRVDGAVLSPERLAQTMLDVRTGTPDPPAFSDYDTRILPRDHVGRADYVFVFDRSGSMMGEKSVATAGAAVICLEAFAGMQRDGEDLAERSGSDIDIDIRCAIFTYNDAVSVPKPLSSGLTLQERLDTLAELRSPNGGNADTHVLQAILEFPPEAGRTRTLIVVSDGEADDPELARSKVEQLRRMGWRVYGISIGSDAAVHLYAPHGHRVDDPATVPQVMRRLVEASL